MKRGGYADLPLHYGSVPLWLAERMSRLGKSIIESLIYNYGKKEVLRRLSDPCWFQAFGCALGMDWHSSGITTSVLGALKKSINPASSELGIYICGGRGRYSRATPNELLSVSEKTGLNGDELIKSSRLSAKIDNTAVQDGFQLYLYNFIVSDEGDWAVVQQGMNPTTKLARRYHWHSSTIKTFDEEPHTAVVGENQGLILNLTHKDAAAAKKGIVTIAAEHPDTNLAEIKKLTMSSRHSVTARDVDLKRLGATLALAYESNITDFCSLLLTPGLGPRTLQALTLVSELIFGTASRFQDPARFSFAHGGKDGHPFPVPLKIYDESIANVKDVVNSAKLGYSDKMNCLKRLYSLNRKIEEQLTPTADFDTVIKNENLNSVKYGGRTVFD